MFVKGLMFFWVAITIAVLLATIPAFVWLGVRFIQKRWRGPLRKVLIALGAYVLFTAVTGAGAYRYYTTEHHRTFGVSFDLKEPLFEYHSERAFNGDGYSIRVYPLPDEVRARFDRKSSNSLPLLDPAQHDRHSWSAESWRASPVEPRFEKYVSFALTSYGHSEKQKLSEHFDAIRSALAGSSAYYGFLHYDHGERPGNIDFFVVDPIGGRIYLINHNT